MAIISLATEAAAAGDYPSNQFNKRERKLLQSVKAYADGGTAATHKVVKAGNFTTAGGDANESISLTGALATDIAFVVLKTAGAVPRTILTSAAATNAINVVLSGDPSTDHVLSYQLLRAVV